MKIPQPQDFKVGGISMNWNKVFSAKQTEMFCKAQKFVDSECIRLMVPYTPTLTTVLRKSATIGTVIGSGEIHQNTPYARYQYYGRLMVSSVTGSSYARFGESKILTNIPLEYNTSRYAKAGKMWFERMKADNKTQILNGAKKIIGG